MISEGEIITMFDMATKETTNSTSSQTVLYN